MMTCSVCGASIYNSYAQHARQVLCLQCELKRIGSENLKPITIELSPAQHDCVRIAATAVQMPDDDFALNYFIAALDDEEFRMRFLKEWME